MSIIHSIANNPVVQQQPGQSGEMLGTEGFDFLSAILGLQADQRPEWWKELGDFSKENPSPTDANPFGPGAALPTIADGMLAGLKLDAPTPQAPEAALQAQLKVDDATLRSAVRTAEEVTSAAVGGNLNLLAEPLEGKQSYELKELVDSVWGKDLRSIQVEEKPETTVDTTHHEILKAMHMPTQAKPEQVAAQEDRSAGFVKESLATVTEPVAKADKKTDRGEALMGLGMPGERVLEKDLASVEKPAETFATQAKAVALPQVRPTLDSLIAQGGGKMTLELDPPELGRLTIEVTTRGKHVELSIQSDNDQVRAALESGLPDLQQALQTQDLQLSHAEVKSGGEASFASFSFNKNNGGQDSHSQGGQFSQQNGERENQFSRFEPSFQNQTVARSRPDGRLDFRV
ncbi:flagellar hook-length control protein FliK [bacterium]|nr:flagellar hook-length control protein FliK [bacterium]